MEKRKIKRNRKIYFLKFTKERKKYLSFQRTTSFICALIGLILLSPVFLFLCAWIVIDDGRPVFFKQKRVARSKSDGTYQYFWIYKFRTMRRDTPKDMPTHLIQDPDRYITKAGHFLRKTSLDELPQLINVIKGDMNLIGPRPALYNQEDLLRERDTYGANFIRPGITGLAQVMGRDELPISVKARYDGIYAQNLSLKMDLACLIRTIKVVASSEGVVEGGTGAMEHKKKILVITNHSYMLYQFRRELIAELLKTHDVVISMPFVGHEDDFKAMGCRCIKTDIDRRGINPITDFKLLCFYHQMIKKEKPDQVITYSIKPNIYAGLICSWQKISYIANVQGLGTAFQQKNLAMFVTFLYKAAFGKVKQVLFENQGNADEFIKRKIIEKEKITVLHGAGVNLDHYAYTTYPDNKEFHFLYLGRIMKEKGVDELFECIERLHGVYGSQVVLDIVGFFEDEYKEKIDHLVSEHMAVFHGFQQETRPFYSQADCIVLPSWHEGMSNVLLEASAIGRPVITSNIPGCREAVEDGKTGLLCQVKDANDLYLKMDQMIKMSKEGRTQMGLAARKRMEELFDKEKIVEQTLAVIKQ